MTIPDAPQCQNAACGREITVIPGHRARKYCNDNCKQAAYLARQDAAERVRIADEEAERLRLEMEMLHQRWGDLLPDTLQQLKALKDRAGMTIADQIVAAFKGEVAQQINHNQEQQREAELEEERTKYAALHANHMQSLKKIGYLERQVQRAERMEIVNNRDSLLHELMLLGGRLKYASMTDLGIGEGIDQWLNYARGENNEGLAKAIAHGFYQANSLAMAAIEASESKFGLHMRQRIDALERGVALRDARIAELEDDRGQEAGDALRNHQIEQQTRRIVELEAEVQEKISKILQMEESHGSTMFTMNHLLAQAQQRGEPATEQQLEKDLDAVRINAASEDLLKTAYGQALSMIKECEAEIAHLKKRISKQYEQRIVKQQAHIEELERTIECLSREPKKAPGDSDRGTMATRFMSLAERLHYCRLLVPHINPGIESWQHFVENASYDQLNEAVATAEHYYSNLIYLDELEQRTRATAHEKKAS